MTHRMTTRTSARQASGLCRPASAWQRIALAVVGLAAFGCEPEPSPQPDAREATFEAVFAVMDQSGCATAGCHGGDTLQAALDLDGVAVAYEQLVDVECANPEAESAGLLRVSSGDPDSSFLLTKLAMTSNDPVLGLPMPPVGELLGGDDLALVRRWIEAGAPGPDQ